MSTQQEQTPLLAELSVVMSVAAFASRAVRRHARKAAIVWGTTTLLAVVALMVLPKMYRVETRILTHRNDIIPALVSPGRKIPRSADNPTRGAIELLKSRESLLYIIDEADLINSWEAARSPTGRLKDKLRRFLFGAMTDEDFRVALVELLDTRFRPWVEGDVLIMRVEWHDPNVALRIAQVAQKRFLNLKRDTDLAQVRETVKILQQRLEQSRSALERAGKEVERIASRPGAANGPVPMKTITVKRPPLPADPVIAAKVNRLNSELAQLKPVLAKAERTFSQQLAEARKKLRALQESLGPGHPDVQEAMRLVDVRSNAGPELASVRRKKAAIAAQISALSPKGQDVYQTIQVPDQVALEARRSTRRLDPELETATRNLQERIRRHNEAAHRLEIAETEVVTAKAAFEFRYIVTRPPMPPKKHVSPKAPLVLGTGLFGGLFLALLFSILADLASRRVIEAWQIRQETGIQVLGVIRVRPDAVAKARRDI